MLATVLELMVLEQAETGLALGNSPALENSPSMGGDCSGRWTAYVAVRAFAHDHSHRAISTFCNTCCTAGDDHHSDFVRVNGACHDGLIPDERGSDPGNSPVQRDAAVENETYTCGYSHEVFCTDHWGTGPLDRLAHPHSGVEENETLADCSGDEATDLVDVGPSLEGHICRLHCASGAICRSLYGHGQPPGAGSYQLTARKPAAFH